MNTELQEPSFLTNEYDAEHIKMRFLDSDPDGTDPDQRKKTVNWLMKLGFCW